MATGLFLCLIAEPSLPLKEARATVLRVLWLRLELVISASVLRRTRAPERPARHIFHSVDALPHSNHDGMPAICSAINSYSPKPMQRIDPANDSRYRQESQRKQRKRRQQLLYEIELKRGDAAQQHPHPLPVLVRLADLDLAPTRGHELSPDSLSKNSNSLANIRCTNLP